MIKELENSQNYQLGFSIKSLTDKSSTLYNLQNGINFIYKINLPDNKKKIDVDTFNEESFKTSLDSITVSLIRLEELGCQVNFDSIQSKKLELNLTMIDSKLPLILSYLVFYNYRYNMNNMVDLVHKLNKENPLNYNLSLGHLFYEFKIKNLLSDYPLLSLDSGSLWGKQCKAVRKNISEKSENNVLSYHSYDKKEFQDYLINHTKLEKTSTGEDRENLGYPSTARGTKPFKFGWVYEEDGGYFIKLNLQIRFK